MAATVNLDYNYLFASSLAAENDPRMKKARELVEQKQVSYSTKQDGDVEAYVKGNTSDYYVQITADGDRCTCDWFAKNQGSRGPCSHILAAELAIQENQGVCR